MKEFIAKLAIAVGLCLSTVGCGWLIKVPKENEPVYGTHMLNSYVMTATEWQVDSICNADALPEMKTWMVTSFKDYETGNVVVKHMYFKSVGEKEIVYIITGVEEPYSVQRRITE